MAACAQRRRPDLSPHVAAVARLRLGSSEVEHHLRHLSYLLLRPPPLVSALQQRLAALLGRDLASITVLAAVAFEAAPPPADADGSSGGGSASGQKGGGRKGGRKGGAAAVLRAQAYLAPGEYMRRWAGGS